MPAARLALLVGAPVGEMLFAEIPPMAAAPADRIVREVQRCWRGLRNDEETLYTIAKATHGGWGPPRIARAAR